MQAWNKDKDASALHATLASGYEGGLCVCLPASAVHACIGLTDYLLTLLCACMVWVACVQVCVCSACMHRSVSI